MLKCGKSVNLKEVNLKLVHLGKKKPTCLLPVALDHLPYLRTPIFCLEMTIWKMQFYAEDM